MKNLTILVVITIILASCQPTDTEKRVTSDNKFSISLPSFLTKVSNLNEDASLQYQHAWKEFYVIVIDETREEIQKALTDNNLTERYPNNIDGYADLILDNFTQSIVVSNKSIEIDTLINNLPAKVLTVSGQVEGIDAFYYLAFIEGKQRYYQIMTWTLSSKEYEHKEKMKRLLYSFKEI